MPPVRRYLRVSRYTVLEVRIYLDNPSDAHRWLLRRGNPALPRVIEAVRPLILPKLREENDRAKKGSKKKGVKDVVVKDDFEVSVFLMNLSTPHSVLIKQRVLKDNDDGESGPATGTKDAPVDVEDGDPIVMREEDGDEMDMNNIPAATDMSPKGEEIGSVQAIEDGDEQTSEARGLHEIRKIDDKKKLGLNTTYEGFRIYGRILCLVVKRTDASKQQSIDSGTGQAMLEQWISSTQEPSAMTVD